MTTTRATPPGGGDVRPPGDTSTSAGAGRRRRSLLVGVLATAAAYLLAARYALMLGQLSELGAVFWPAAGVTVTALLVSPRRWWPALLATVAVTELGHDLLLGFPVPASLAWALANVVVGSTVAWTLQTWEADHLERAGQVLRFTVVALTVPVLGGTIGALGTVTTDTTVPYLVIALKWGLGDGLGILTVAPLGLVLLRGGLRTDRPWEAAAALSVVLATTVFVFVLGPPAFTASPVAYLVVLPLLWAAARFGVAGAAVTVTSVALLANPATAFGNGPFANAPGGALEASALLQLFLATVTIAALIVASRTVESERYQHLAALRAQLLSVVSHELRTPLTPILGFSELLLRDRSELSPRCAQAATVIHRNSQHLAAVIDDLLAMTRARRDGSFAHPTTLELGPFLTELLDDHAEPSVALTLPPRRAWVHADPTHLFQIVVNLLGNAARYGRPPVTITVSVTRGHVDLTVTDAGQGVPDWFVPDLFEVFAQANVGDRRPTSGLGLGLPIARDLARANGGDLTYRHAPGGGACFTLRLPLATDAPPDDGTPGAGATGDEATGDGAAVEGEPSSPQA